MAKAKVIKTMPLRPVVPAPLTGKRLELTKRLYALAGDPDKADEFEAVRLELAALL